MSCSQANLKNGLSLIEVAVSSLLVGTVVVGSLSMMGASVRTQTYSSDLAKGPFLAEALLAEIMSMPYHDPETDSGSNSTNSGEMSVTRQDFDDVGDFNGWSTSTVQDRIGNALSGYSGWSRAVTVKWADRINGDVWNLYDTGLKRITVTVTSPEGTVTQRFGVRSKNGSLEQQPLVDKLVVPQIETSLSIGAAATTAHGVTNLLNHVGDPNG